MYMYGRAEYNYGIQYSAAVQYTEGQIGGVKWSGMGVVGGIWGRAQGHTLILLYRINYACTMMHTELTFSKPCL